MPPLAAFGIAGSGGRLPGAGPGSGMMRTAVCWGEPLALLLFATLLPLAAI